MLRNRYVKWGGIIAFLILANILNYIYWNWGLITVKVTDAPLSKVIKSIEWQGWVTIYTNLPADAKVTMWVDHVPLAEAMETLANNIEVSPTTLDRPDRPDRLGSPGAPGSPGTNGPGMVPPGGTGASGGFTGGSPSPGSPGENHGWRGRGGPWGGVQWNLGFFVAPTSAKVKEEIHAFQEGSVDDDTKVYNYSTPIQMVVTSAEDDMPVSDPRVQTWPGIKPTKPTPAPDPATQTSPSAAGDDPAVSAVASPPPPPPAPTLHTYLKAFAKGANIWIMAPSSWAPEISTPPPPSSSIISAVKDFVSRAHGSVTQAIILRGGWGLRGGADNHGADFTNGNSDNLDTMADRVRNAINGLPEEDRADALAQLDQEVKFFQDVRSAPEDQQMQMVREHIADKMANNDRSGRMNPEKRSSRIQQIVSNRETVQGQK